MLVFRAIFEAKILRWSWGPSWGGTTPRILALRMEPSATGKPRLEPALASRLLRFDSTALSRGAPLPSLSYRNPAICSASHAVAPSQRKNGRFPTALGCQTAPGAEVPRNFKREGRWIQTRDGMWRCSSDRPGLAGRWPSTDFRRQTGSQLRFCPSGIPCLCPCHQSLSCFPVPRFAPDSSSDRLELRTTKRGCIDLEWTTWSLSALKRSTSLSPPLPVPPLQSHPTPSPPQPSPALPS